jgi:hypothetical protein
VQAALGQLDLLVADAAAAVKAESPSPERIQAGGPEAARGRRSSSSDPRPVTRGSPRGVKAPTRAPLEALGAAIAGKVSRGPHASRRRAHK